MNHITVLFLMFFLILILVVTSKTLETFANSFNMLNEEQAAVQAQTQRQAQAQALTQATPITSTQNVRAIVDPVYENMSCWDAIKKHYGENQGVNLDSLVADEKKIILSMRKLHTFSYTDADRIPQSYNQCVIPTEHLPLFNIANTANAYVDMNNPANRNPNPSDPSVLRLTKLTEYPKGYVVDLGKYPSQSNLQQFLNAATTQYNSEFAERIQRLEQERDQKKSELSSNIAILDAIGRSINSEISKSNDIFSANHPCSIRDRDIRIQQSKLDTRTSTYY